MEKRKVDVIIFSGQSNMQGQSERLSESAAVENAYEFKYLDRALVPLKNPLGEDIRYDGLVGERFTNTSDQGEWLSGHVLGSACYGHTNLVPSFARAYIEQTQTALIAVHAAKGSTEIKDWLPETAGYKMLVRKAAAAIQKAKEEYCIDRILFVWLQGESDAIAARTKEYYKEKLHLLADGLKEDLNIERFGIIRVGAFTRDGRDDEIIEAQDEICRETPFFSMLTDCALTLNKDDRMMNPYVEGHYSAQGLEYLGKVAGSELGKKVCKDFL